MESAAERERIIRIVSEITRGVVVGETAPIDDPHFVERVVRMMRTFGFINPIGDTDESYAWEFCNRWSPSNPKRLFGALFLSAAGCSPDDGFSCEGCSVKADCSSVFDPRNRPEECGE